MKKVVHLAVYDGISDWEYGYVVAHLNSPEFQKHPQTYEIKTVGRTVEPIKTKGGITLLPDMVLNELNYDQSAMLILAGSESAATGGIDDFVHKAKSFVEHGICVAAICGATAALAKNGLLDDVTHTSNAKEFLAMTGYAGSHHYIEKPAVASEYIITASGIEPVAFAVEIFRKLEIYSDEMLNAWIKLFGEKDLSGFFELMESNAQ